MPPSKQSKSVVLRVKNAEAAGQLQALLDPALAELRQLGSEPILIAECPDKYNDAFNDDYWYAAQVGAASWEQSHFFEGGDYASHIKEGYHLRGQILGGAVAEPARLATGKPLSKARAILHRLKDGGWRALAVEALRDRYPILCLAWQYGQAWFCLSSAVEGEGYAWALTPNGGFAEFGMCGRLDHEIGNPCPIWFSSIDPGAVRFLTPEARQFFAPRPIDSKAHRQLCTVIATAVADAAAANASEIAFLSAGSRASVYEDSGNVYSGARLPLVVVDGYEMPMLNADGTAPQDYRASVYDHCRDQLLSLSPIARRLEEADWRTLFGQAFGTPLVKPQMLALFVAGGRALLVRENSVFTVTGSDLVFAGLCEYPSIRDHPPTPVMPKSL